MLRVLLASLLSFVVFLSPAHAKQLIVSGSTSVTRLMDVLAEKYNQQHPETFIAVQGVGSTAGISMTEKGVANLGMSSRYLTEQESKLGLHTVHIATDGLAVVVNFDNPVKNLTRQQLADIYQGKITNWKQVGGEDIRIAVVTREASSGSRYSFESLLGLTKIINGHLVSDINTKNLVVSSNSMVKSLISHNPQAIGFISIGSIDRSIQPVQFEGVDATSANIANHSYKLSRPFFMIYKEGKLIDENKQFIDFILSKPGQDLIEQYGYTPVSHLK